MNPDAHDPVDYRKLTEENARLVFEAEMRGDAVVPAPPWKFTFELTAHCNIHCFFCDCEMIRKQYRDRGFRNFALPVEQFRIIAEQAFPRASVINPTVVGEPLTIPYFDEMLDALEKYGTRLEIVTNGMLLRGKKLRRMLPLLYNLIISFDGATTETFERVRTGASFERVMENLGEFARLRREMGLRDRVHFQFHVTLMRENIQELPRIIEIAAAHDADLVTAAYLVVFTEELRASSVFNDPALANASVKEAWKRAEALGVRAQLPIALPEDVAKSFAGTQGVPMASEPPAPTATSGDGSGGTPATKDETRPPVRPDFSGSASAAVSAGSTEGVPVNDAGESSADRTAEKQPQSRTYDEQLQPGWKGKMFCKFAWREVFISHQGDVAPCCAQGRPVLGNAYAEDFMSLWNGPTYQALRRGLYEGKPLPFCRDCIFLQEVGDTTFQPDRYLRKKHS